MKLSMYIIFLICTVSTSSAQHVAKYSIKKVNEHVYIFTELWSGSNNANVGVVIGYKGVLLTSSLMEKSAPSLVAEIKKITDKPIRFVLNSDSDPYNYHANKFFAERGATIISHENLLYTNAYTELRFKDRISIPMGDEIVTAYHSPAHQFNHIDIHLEKSNVIFTSDAIKTHWLTPIGPNGLTGLLETFDKAIALSDENTIIVSGNTSKNPKKFVRAKKDLIRMRQVHVDITARVGELHRKGLSRELIAQDEFIQKTMKQFEVYPKFKKWIPSSIGGIISSEFTKSIKMSENEQKSYVGHYKLDRNTEIEIILEDGRLIARSKGQFIFELIALSKEKFDFKTTRNNFITFQFSSAGEVKSLTPTLKGWWAQLIKPGIHIKSDNKRNVK